MTHFWGPNFGRGRGIQNFFFLDRPRKSSGTDSLQGCGRARQSPGLGDCLPRLTALAACGKERGADAAQPLSTPCFCQLPESPATNPLQHCRTRHLDSRPCGVRKVCMRLPWPPLARMPLMHRSAGYHEYGDDTSTSSRPKRPSRPSADQPVPPAGTAGEAVGAATVPPIHRLGFFRVPCKKKKKKIKSQMDSDTEHQTNGSNIGLDDSAASLRCIHAPYGLSMSPMSHVPCLMCAMPAYRPRHVAGAALAPPFSSRSSPGGWAALTDTMD